jgi:hypothetical protein
MDIASLLQVATQLEDAKFENGGGDIDGFELSSRPPSPLTDLEEIDPTGMDEMESSMSQSSSATATKKRRKNAAKKRRSLKRIAKARSGHAAASYTANPSVLENLEDAPAIEADLRAEELPSSSDGYWVGK